MTTNYKYHLPELEVNYTRQNIIVFSGASTSAESGLSTSRDMNVLWILIAYNIRLISKRMLLKVLRLSSTGY